MTPRFFVHTNSLSGINRETFLIMKTSKSFALLLLTPCFVGFLSCDSQTGLGDVEKNYVPAPANVQAVDLGLSVKWASCNVGAVIPEGFGNYYAWGEVLPKEDYSWSTYKYTCGSQYSLTKYCNNSSYGNDGFTDTKTTLDLENDAAYVNWGGAWRMPTDDEWEELLNNCKWTWTTKNGVNGYWVMSKTNSNSIFLPAAGCRHNASLGSVGVSGLYWSASLGSDFGCAGGLYFSFNLAPI